MWPFRQRCDQLSVLSAQRAERTGEPSITASPVVIDRIVGTVARCCDFDRCFRPLRPHLKQRLARLREAMRERQLPAVRLHQVGQDYYVVDGHHRLALARERGMVAVDAIVTCRC